MLMTFVDYRYISMDFRVVRYSRQVEVINNVESCQLLKIAIYNWYFFIVL